MKALIAIVTFGLAVLVLYAGLRIHSAKQAERGRRIILSNAAEVRLLGMSMGGQIFTTEKPWQKAARAVLPARFAGWIPTPATGNCGSGSNSLTFYFEAIHSTNSAPETRQVPWEEFGASDDDGFHYRRDSGHCSFGYTTNSTIYGLNLRAFPRRQTHFNFHFFGHGGTNLGTMRVANPFQGPFQQWSPSPLPQTRSNGPVRLTLTSLREAGSDQYRFYAAAWQVQSEDPLWANSRARLAGMSDPTGNDDYWLSVREPAWKLRAYVYRERPEDFLPSQQITLTNLALPGPAQFEVVDRQAFCDLVRVRVRSVSGPGILYLTNGVSWHMRPNEKKEIGSSTSSDSTTTLQRWSTINHMLLVEVVGAEPEDEAQFQVVDQSGTDLKARSDGWHGSAGGGRFYRVHFFPTADSARLNASVRLSRPLSFEFVVDPREVVPAK